MQGTGYLVDQIVDQTGSKGTGKWTVQQAAELSVAAPTITASLDGRYMSAIKPERMAAAKVSWSSPCCHYKCLILQYDVPPPKPCATQVDHSMLAA